jgi:hypothetical protein
MNGLKVSTKTNNLDRHTFQAPSNVVIPDAVGRFSLIEIIVI